MKRLEEGDRRRDARDGGARTREGVVGTRTGGGGRRSSVQRGRVVLMAVIFLCVYKKNLISNRPATSKEPTGRSRAHKLDHASHTYFTSFPFPAPRATLCVGCGWGGENPRTA